MTNQQWTVVGLLGVLFFLEAAKNKTIYNWLVGALNQVSGAVVKK